ncbi:MAG: ribbon-helix-helix protein, CopG family [Fervidicoccaceae archaeon]
MIIIDIFEKRTVSLRVDEETYKSLEAAWRASGFASRSHLLRHLVDKALSDPDRQDLSLEKERLLLMSCSPHKTITFKLDERTLAKLDELVLKLKFGNRSDLLRALLARFIEEQARQIKLQAKKLGAG